MQPWSTQYARSLSVEQWVDEIGARFVKAIQQEVNSLPLREPIKSTLAKCGVEPESLSPCLVDWDIYKPPSSERPPRSLSPTGSL